MNQKLAALFGITILISIIFGMAIAPEKTVTKTQQVCSQATNWKNLKTTDDSAFNIESDIISTDKNFIDDVSNTNFSNVETYAKRINDDTDLLNKYADQRQSILKQLGY